MFLDSIVRSCKTCGRCYSCVDTVWYHPIGYRCPFYNKRTPIFRYYSVKEHPQYFCRDWVKQELNKDMDYDAFRI